MGKKKVYLTKRIRGKIREFIARPGTISTMAHRAREMTEFLKKDFPHVSFENVKDWIKCHPWISAESKGIIGRSSSPRLSMRPRTRPQATRFVDRPREKTKLAYAPSESDDDSSTQTTDFSSDSDAPTKKVTRELRSSTSLPRTNASAAAPSVPQVQPQDPVATAQASGSHPKPSQKDGPTNADNQADALPDATGTVPPDPTGSVSPQATGTVPPDATGTVPHDSTGTVSPQATGSVSPQATGSVSPQATGTVTPRATNGSERSQLESVAVFFNYIREMYETVQTWENALPFLRHLESLLENLQGIQRRHFLAVRTPLAYRRFVKRENMLPTGLEHFNIAEEEGNDVMMVDLTVKESES